MTRPGKWGNPFETAAEFRLVLSAIIRQPALSGMPGVTDEQFEHMWRIARDIGQLKGFDLACWCSLDKACHADVLLEIANGR